MRNYFVAFVLLLAVVAVASAQVDHSKEDVSSDETIEKAIMPMNTWTIHVKNNFFDPADLSDVKVGDQVTFQFHGTHTATSDDITTGSPKKTFNTGKAVDGQSASVFFNYTGTFKYHCDYHPGMTGKITVGPRP